jgi:RNA polymerase sigma-32 factor
LFETKHDAHALGDRLNRAGGVLNDRERLIVRARQLAEEPRPLESLGQELQLSKERIRQLEAAAYTKLRCTLEAEGANFAQFVG